MSYVHQMRRVEVKLNINVMPSQTPSEVVDWVNKFFSFFHPNLEAQVTHIDKFAPAPAVDAASLLDMPAPGQELLETEPEVPADLLSLLGDSPTPENELLS